MSPAFKFDSQSFFLTYPQAGVLTWQEIVDKLRSVRDLEWCRIAREKHADGEPHYHAVGRFVSRVQSRCVRVFDVGGHHPNIQRIRSLRHAIAYVSKDGEFFDIGAVPTDFAEGASFDAWTAARELPKMEFFTQCLKHRVSFQFAKFFWSQAEQQREATIPEDFVPQGRETVEVQGLTFVPEKSNVLIGPSGHGKTSWAKRVIPKPALWVRHVDKLSLFDKSLHKGIVFDEMVFTHYPREAQIQLVDLQDDSHIHCRYVVATIPAGTPRIFTANRDVFLGGDAALNRRIHHQQLIAIEPLWPTDDSRSNSPTPGSA